MLVFPFGLNTTRNHDVFKNASLYTLLLISKIEICLHFYMFMASS